MTAAEMQQYIGRTGTWEVPKIKGSMKIKVRVLDARVAWGRFELKITPVSGSGEVWAQNVVMDPKRRGAK